MSQLGAKKLTCELIMSFSPYHLLALIFLSLLLKFPGSLEIEHSLKIGVSSLKALHRPWRNSDFRFPGLRPHFPSVLYLDLFLVTLWSRRQKLMGQNRPGAVTFMTDDNCYEFPHVLHSRQVSVTPLWKVVGRVP